MTEQNYQITEYSTTAAAIALLREKYGAPFDTTNKEGMAAAKEARAEIRGLRGALEKTRAEIKAPVLERAKLIDAEAKRITAELLAIEEPIDAAIKAEERRKEEEKAAKARAEAERVAAINGRIGAIRRKVLEAANRSAAEIGEALSWALAYQPDPGDFNEFLPDAIDARNETREALEKMLKEREEFEEAQKRNAREREELQRLRADEEARQAQRRREEREAQQAREAEEAKKRAAEEARQAKKAKAAKSKLDPIAELQRAAEAGEIQIGEAISTAYKMGYDDGVVASTTTT